jgi:hypothetical protein
LYWTTSMMVSLSLLLKKLKLSLLELLLKLLLLL